MFNFKEISRGMCGILNVDNISGRYKIWYQADGRRCYTFNVVTSDNMVSDDYREMLRELDDHINAWPDVRTKLRFSALGFKWTIYSSFYKKGGYDLGDLVEHARKHYGSILSNCEQLDGSMCYFALTCNYTDQTRDDVFEFVKKYVSDVRYLNVNGEARFYYRGYPEPNQIPRYAAPVVAETKEVAPVGNERKPIPRKYIKDNLYGDDYLDYLDKLLHDAGLRYSTHTAGFPINVKDQGNCNVYGITFLQVVGKNYEGFSEPYDKEAYAKMADALGDHFILSNEYWNEETGKYVVLARLPEHKDATVRIAHSYLDEEGKPKCNYEDRPMGDLLGKW